MKKYLLIWVLALAASGPMAFAQTPDGTNISQAIPLILNQTIGDAGDAQVAIYRVYSVSLAKGQQFTVAGQVTGGTGFSWVIYLLAPTTKSVLTLNSSDPLFNSGCQGQGNYNNGCGNDKNGSQSLTYQVAAAGTYYILVKTYASSISYNLTVTATGAPLGLPNPPSAGCLTGTVDYVTYSAQLIGYDLPDSISIGGVEACATCMVKAPQYPALASRFDLALAYNVSVKACYDSSGNIFQLTLSNQ